MNTNANLKVTGHVEAFIRRDGVDTTVGSTHNDFQQTGLTVIANSLAEGKGITHVYFIYANYASVPPIGASSGTLTAASLQALESASVGIVRAPIFSMGLETSGTVPDTAVLAAVTDASYHLGGIPFTDGVTVYAAGLVQATEAGDILYAAADITKIAKAANAQVGIRWKTTISAD